MAASQSPAIKRSLQAVTREKTKLSVPNDDNPMPQAGGLAQLNFASTVQAAKEEKHKSDRTRKVCKRVAKFLITTLSLLILNCLWLFGGGMLFKYLELTNEITNCENARAGYEEARGKALSRVVDYTYKLAGSPHTLRDQVLQDMHRDVSADLKTFALKVYNTGYDNRSNCSQTGDSEGDWTTSNSLVYALTIVTTIGVCFVVSCTQITVDVNIKKHGYGVIAPKTNAGRIVTIIYSVVGIPMFLVFLAHIGEIMASAFKSFYWYLCCCGVCRRSKPSNPKEDDEESVHKFSVAKNQSMKRTDVDDDDDEEGDDTGGYRDDITVPLTLAAALLFASIILGGVVFYHTENDSKTLAEWKNADADSRLALEWSFINSVYFSFVTISTLGFGDLVPEIDLEQENGYSKLIIVLLFITFGMAIISMCFQLMADEFVAKITWLGEKCGLKKKTNRPESDEDEGEVQDGQTRARPSTALSRRSNSLRGSFNRRRLLARKGSVINRSQVPKPQTPKSEPIQKSPKPKTRINALRDSKASVSPRTAQRQPTAL